MRPQWQHELWNWHCLNHPFDDLSHSTSHAASLHPAFEPAKKLTYFIIVISGPASVPSYLHREERSKQDDKSSRMKPQSLWRYGEEAFALRCSIPGADDVQPYPRNNFLAAGGKSLLVLAFVQILAQGIQGFYPFNVHSRDVRVGKLMICLLLLNWITVLI